MSSPSELAFKTSLEESSTVFSSDNSFSATAKPDPESSLSLITCEDNFSPALMDCKSELSELAPISCETEASLVDNVPTAKSPSITPSSLASIALTDETVTNKRKMAIKSTQFFSPNSFINSSLQFLM